MNRKEKRFIHIGGVLNKSLKTFRREFHEELPKIWELWNDAVGKVVAENAGPAAFKGKLLLVYVNSSVWIQQLQFQKAVIIKKINKAFGKEMIEDIKFEIGEIRR